MGWGAQGTGLCVPVGRPDGDGAMLGGGLWMVGRGEHLRLKGTAGKRDPMVDLCPNQVGKLRRGMGGGVKEGLAGGLTHRAPGVRSCWGLGMGCSIAMGRGSPTSPPLPPPGLKAESAAAPGGRGHGMSNGDGTAAAGDLSRDFTKRETGGGVGGWGGGGHPLCSQIPPPPPPQHREAGMELWAPKRAPCARISPQPFQLSSFLLGTPPPLFPASHPAP